MKTDTLFYRLFSTAPQLFFSLSNRPYHPGYRFRAVIKLVGLILNAKFPDLSREEINAMLDLPIEDMKQTRFYQQAQEEALEEVARKLLQMEMPLEQIVQVTGLSRERLQQLSSQN